MTLTLEINILSYWRAGRGQNRPGSLDETCQRDSDGLPMIPGKHLKGLLRDALRQANAFGWTKLPPAELFGSGPATNGEHGSTAVAGGAGLRVDSARLPEGERDALAKCPELTAHLFITKRSTAINPATGAAKKGSLRFEEVAVPMTLEATLYPVGDVPANWQAELQKALPLMLGVGAQRTRGLGRCIVMAKDGGPK